MKTVQDYFAPLSFNYLSSLALGNSGSGSIKEADKPKIISLMNEALFRIYTKFSLLEREVFIIQKSHITDYSLDAKYSIFTGDPTQNELYIWDDAQKPFTNDVVKIISVFDDDGQKRPLNDLSNPLSVFTTQPTVLKVPLPIDDEPINIRYQAKHPTLVAETDEVLLTNPAMQTLFMTLISYRAYVSLGTQEALIKAQAIQGEYMDLIKDVENNSFHLNTESPYHDKFYRAGWV